jgi:hypothetical protein
MSTPRSVGWHRLASRAATAGMILGIASLAVGLFVMAPIASRSNADDSASSGDTIVLVLFGLTVAVASAGLWAGEALRWRVCLRRRAGRADGFPRPR